MTRYYFNDKKSAEDAYETLRDIANSYGYASVKDMKSIIGNNYYNYPNHNDTMFGWTPNMLSTCTIYSCHTGAYLVLPNEEYFGHCESEENEPTDDYTGYPLVNITIHTNELKSPIAYISDILKEVSQIKDRTVNITIM